ncbi:hypothetical protein [Pelagerythrobacter marensis]|uniref:Uncharacterized protein n=1 Tax=Pelagerythrobacter marensis TaxID=543877 RepID=A0A0G3XBM3_9SPHN|nr:hypothetical protein [Pelagerythrobacter marensis]AKM07788.1 hypothetical protein AM2010_1722 [Pelagerythrobacter marensis]
MSRQLTFSATVSVLVMALFVIASGFEPAVNPAVDGSAPFPFAVQIGLN